MMNVRDFRNLKIININKKFAHSKSGQAVLGSKSIYYLVFALVLTLLTFALYGLSNEYVGSAYYVDDNVIHEIMAERVITCFSTNQYGRPVLNPSLMTESRLKTCFATSERGIRTILEDETSHAILADIHAGGTVANTRIPYSVIYTEGGKIRRGILKVDITR